MAHAFMRLADRCLPHGFRIAPKSYSPKLYICTQMTTIDRVCLLVFFFFVFCSPLRFASPPLHKFMNFIFKWIFTRLADRLSVAASCVCCCCRCLFYLFIFSASFFFFAFSSFVTFTLWRYFSSVWIVPSAYCVCVCEYRSTGRLWARCERAMYILQSFTLLARVCSRVCRNENAWGTHNARDGFNRLHAVWCFVLTQREPSGLVDGDRSHNQFDMLFSITWILCQTSRCARRRMDAMWSLCVCVRLRCTHLTPKAHVIARTHTRLHFRWVLYDRLIVTESARARRSRDQINPWPIWTAQNTKCTIWWDWIRRARETRISDRWLKPHSLFAEFWRLFLHTRITKKKQKKIKF